MEARTRYLSSAARLCATTSPSTSAHLMLERSTLSSITEIKKTKPDPAPHCYACGTFLIPGITSKKTTRSRRKQPSLPNKHGKNSTSNDLKSRGTLDTVIVEECLACYRSSTHPLPATTRSRSTVAAEGTLGTESGVVDRQLHVPSRNRKKRPRDLLGKMKAEEEKAKASRGLDLMDFLRPA